MIKLSFLIRIIGVVILSIYITPIDIAHAQIAVDMEVEYVDASGVRAQTTIVDGVTTISGIAPFLVKFDASGTRTPDAFAAQSAITDAEAFAFLMAGYRINYGEGVGGTWTYPAGTAFSKDEDTGPPIFSYVYTTAGVHNVQLKVRDTLGNEDTINFTVNVSAAPAATHIPVSAGSWPAFVSGGRYTLDADGDYRSFGTLETGGLHNIIIEKIGSGADPRIDVFSPDGRSKFDATEMYEFRAAHIRLVNIDVDHFITGQRGYDYVGVIGGLVRRFSDGAQAYAWNEGSDIVRTNVRFARGLFLLDTELRSTSAGSGFIMFGTFNGLHARNTRFIHAENGPTTYLMLRVYGSNFTFRNNLWYSQVNGGGANGTVIGMLAVSGATPTAWRDDDMVGPLSGVDFDDNYGYISEKQILQNNQIYDAGSYVTNAIASIGGGNPSGSNLVYPRLMGWEDNVFFPEDVVALVGDWGQVIGQYNFWRNSRKDMGAGAHITAYQSAPNSSVGDSVTYNGPVLIEETNSRPVPTSFSSTPAPVITFSASPTSITNGSSTTLTWSTTNANVCTASNGWSGSQATSSSLVVTPIVSTTYTLTCTGDGGSDVESSVVTVNSVVVTPPSSGGGGGGGGGSSNSSVVKFSTNQTVILLATTVVRDLNKRTDLGTQASSSIGRVLSKTVKKISGVTYYQIAFVNGLTGWVPANRLATYKTTPVGTPVAVVVPTSIYPLVQTIDRVNLRISPGGILIGQLPAGTQGVVQNDVSPVQKDGYNWVYVKFGSGAGYVAKEFLRPLPTAIQTPVVNTSVNLANSLLLLKIQELLAQVEILRAKLRVMQVLGL